MRPVTGLTPNDDDSLFARARGGDDAAWEELFRRCYPKVIRVVRRKLNNPAMRALYDSTDFVSDVMMSLAENAKRWEFASLGSLITFLERVAEQKVIDEYRKVHSLKRGLDKQCHLGGAEAGEGAGPAAPGPSPSQHALAAETRDVILSGCEKAEREVVELKQQGYSNQEIAAKLNWNIRKVQRFFQSLEASYLRSVGA